MGHFVKNMRRRRRRAAHDAHAPTKKMIAFTVSTIIVHDRAADQSFKISNVSLFTLCGMVGNDEHRQ
jgi:hypothetical protein